ncbi:MAG: HNH endonuclease [Hyphomonadaceae bacterium]|nr:HNH endonuclease [Hyphomonadaceae bacterium]
MSDEKGPTRDRHCRRRPSSTLRRLILSVQNGRCFSCGAALVDVEFDHVIPLGLGGDNSPDNWAAVCPPCHTAKTRLDLKRMAKAKRQRRYHETGRSRAKSKFSPIIGACARGFDKTKRRHMNGVVTNQCSCSRCRPKSGA